MVIQFEAIQDFKECINLCIKYNEIDFATDIQNLKLTVYNMRIGKSKLDYDGFATLIKIMQ